MDAVILLQNTEHYYAYKKNVCNASSNWLRLQKKAAKVQFLFSPIREGRKCLSVSLSTSMQILSAAILCVLPSVFSSVEVIPFDFCVQIACHCFAAILLLISTR